VTGGLALETINTYYENRTGLKEFIAENRGILLTPNRISVLVQVFSGICDLDYLGTLCQQIRALIPGAQVIGTTTNGEIMNGKVSGLKTVLSFSVFHNSYIQVAFAEMTDGNAVKLGRSIAHRLTNDKGKVLILFATGSTLNAGQVLKGIQLVNPALPVAGGSAGDNISNRKCFVFCNENITECGVVGAMIAGDDLIVSRQSHLAWQPIGKEMNITKAEGHRVYTIDNMPAYQVYCRYLGIDATDDIYNVIEFPLSMERHGFEICRSPFLRHDDDSLSFLGDMFEGERVRFSFGHVEMIIDKLDTLLQTIKQHPVESIFVYSCVSRRGFLQEAAEIETLPLQEIAPTAGFFTTGEFFHADNSNQFLNATMTTLALFEAGGGIQVLPEPKTIPHSSTVHNDGLHMKDNVADRNIEVLKALTHLINTVTHELNERTADLETANQIINEREERLRLVLEGSTEGFWDWNLETGKIYKSERWISLLGYSIHEPHLHHWAKAVHPEDIGATMQMLNDYLEGRIPKYETEYRLMTNAGEIKWIFECGSVVKRDQNGKPLRIAGTCTDITERKESDARLRLSEDKFSKAFRCNPDPITITTLQEGYYIEMNDAWVKRTGFERHEAYGHTSGELGIWISPGDRARMLKQIKQQGRITNFETQFRSKSGRIGLYNVSAEIIEMGHETHLLSVHNDITERRQAEEKIRYLSYHDKLTGLYNRTYFEEELERISVGGDFPYGLLIGDVNGLKLINDALGHQEGDKVLIKAAELLKASCRPEDTISRWGGDEFIVLMPGCESSIPLDTVQHINDSFKGIDNMPIQVNISLGMAMQTSPRQNIRDVIREAEEKMYRNKLLESRSTRSAFIQSLQKALWERSHETEQHCQRMQKISENIGKTLGLSESELDSLKLLAALHDIGKIAIPDAILNKPERLSPDEWVTVKTHPEIGYRIALSSPELAPIAEAILHHHEWWDGNGYPLGLKGESIPLISRVIAITDAYDVMLNGRPYKEAMTEIAVLQEIQRCAGTQFDPLLVDKLIRFNHCLASLS
jgi:PAS domain S-box/diguanylate cyclase (GGDEF) domain